MASDRDRLSYDEKQQYRSVVAQQGRVTLAADFNESQEIIDEETRKEALDFVGPAGTPDDGYKVTFPTPSPNFDFFIGSGTMYVGGMRAALPAQIRYFAQPDWIDAPPPAQNPTREFIYLDLQEQEIGAVEDSSLKDVALGGPDTAQRTRLLQHIVRTNTQAADCAAALQSQIANWTAQGLQFDPATMRLNPLAKLKVGFDTSGPPPGPCEPAATGGYLGAENQLIRVGISGQREIVWGFDNSSFLYRVDVVDNQTLKLQTPPVDAFHQPRVGQAVEILRAEAKLSNDELVAYDVGRIDVLTEAYNPDTQTIRLPAALTNEFLVPGGTPRLFLRVWEQKLPFTPGTPVTLGNTGVQVTLQSTGAFFVGSFWAFAVRPTTPVEVYPQRYKIAFQPPDGPRHWACPLAVISWTVTAGTAGNIISGTVLADCREQFDNLVELTKRKPGGGCCILILKPEDLNTISLQAVVDQFKGKGNVTICFSPGTYTLQNPLVLSKEHTGLTLEGCHDEVAITAAAGMANNFVPGLIVLNRADNITLRGLSFHVPLASLANAKIAELGTPELDLISGPDLKNISAGIGVRVLACSGLTIEDCGFSLQPPPPQTVSVFEAAVLAAGECSGLKINNNRFTHQGDPLELSQTAFGIRVGILMTPVTRSKLTGGAGAPTLGGPADGIVLPSALADASINGNLFSGLSAAVFLYADIGAVTLEGNTVRGSASGFWLLSLRTLPFADKILPSRAELKQLIDPLANDQVILLGSTLARGYPLPTGFTIGPAEQIKVKQVPWTAPLGANVQPPPLKRGFILHSLLVALEAQAFTDVKAKKFELAALSSENEVIAAFNTGNVVRSLAGLFVWNEDGDTTSSLILSANQIRHQAAGRALPTATIAQVSRCSVTGNLVLNESPESIKISLMVVPPRTDLLAVAITGNVLKGVPVLPPRPLAAPLDRWDVLNAVLPI